MVKWVSVTCSSLLFFNFGPSKFCLFYSCKHRSQVTWHACKKSFLCQWIAFFASSLTWHFVLGQSGQWNFDRPVFKRNVCAQPPHLPIWAIIDTAGETLPNVCTRMARGKCCCILLYIHCNREKSKEKREEKEKVASTENSVRLSSLSLSLCVLYMLEPGYLRSSISSLSSLSMSVSLTLFSPLHWKQRLQWVRLSFLSQATYGREREREREKSSLIAALSHSSNASSRSKSSRSKSVVEKHQWKQTLT